MTTTEERADEIAATVMQSYGIKPYRSQIRQAIADAAQIGLEDGLRPTSDEGDPSPRSLDVLPVGQVVQSIKVIDVSGASKAAIDVALGIFHGEQDEKLRLADHEMEEHHVEDIDLVWGFKSFRTARGFVQFALEVRYRQPGHEKPIYVRLTDSDSVATSRAVVRDLMELLARLLTEPEYRREVAEWQAAHPLT
jgi:hypothetical protein